MLHRTLVVGCFAVFAGMASAVHAEWTLDAASSSLHYVTSKNAAVSEVNRFTGLTGSISDAGKATLSIDLATVDTAIDIRNQRMRDLVFQVAQFPKADVSVQVDLAPLRALAVGESVTAAYPISVSLHGVVAEITADLQVVKMAGDALQVQLAKPLIIAAGQFGLDAGVEELRKIANLTTITPNVVVDFSLRYAP
jgi:hypothetical protein